MSELNPNRFKTSVSIDAPDTLWPSKASINSGAVRQSVNVLGTEKRHSLFKNSSTEQALIKENYKK